MFSPYTYPIRIKKYPKNIPVFIEVQKGSRCKYEYNCKTGFLTLDRILHSAVYYPYNYGFIPQTLCNDGDPLDILVMSDESLVPGCFVNVRPICYMIMEDEKGLDEKVLGVISNDPNYEHVKCIKDIQDHKLKEISQFFETYKALEKNKWVKVGDWNDINDTHVLIKNMHEKYLSNIAKTVE